MARALNKLTARSVAAIRKPGRHGDGGGLYLVVDRASGTKRWAFLYRRAGRLREMGLGSALAVTLADARDLAAEARRVVALGKDPIAERQASRKPVPTFGAFADEYLDGLEKTFRNDKHRAQWRMTLAEYAKPLRGKPIDQITTADVVAILEPIWLTKHETASRLRGRIERVLDAAKVKGHRSGENPALWRGHLAHVLQKPRGPDRNHPAMPYARVPAFMQRLRRLKSVSARALEFTILTAARSGETFGATWKEIDLDGAAWVIPAERMRKGDREHSVPLSPRAVEILREMAAFGVAPGAFVFPGQRPGKPLSNMAMEMQLRRLDEGAYTVHGFRSAFRDWAGDCTGFAREVAEAALSHAVGDQSEQAYRRGSAFAKRRKLMAEWCAYCYSTEAVAPAARAA